MRSNLGLFPGSAFQQMSIILWRWELTNWGTTGRAFSLAICKGGRDGGGTTNKIKSEWINLQQILLCLPWIQPSLATGRRRVSSLWWSPTIRQQNCTCRRLSCLSHQDASEELHGKGMHTCIQNWEVFAILLFFPSLYLSPFPPLSSLFLSLLTFGGTPLRIVHMGGVHERETIARQVNLCRKIIVNLNGENKNLYNFKFVILSYSKMP